MTEPTDEEMKQPDTWKNVVRLALRLAFLGWLAWLVANCGFYVRFK
jgi:hypothetical protein